MDNTKRNPDNRNYAKIRAAIEFIEQRLAPYTEQKVRETHQDIYKKMAGHPACTQNCSSTFPHQKQSWCNSCIGWRNLLADCNSSAHHIVWENVSSGDWPKNHLNIIAVFIPNSKWDAGNYQDLSTACHIWSNMKSCKISPDLIKRVRKERNSFAHNSAHSSTSRDMSEAFEAFRDLLNDHDIAKKIDTSDALQGLYDIEKGVGEDKQLRKNDNEQQSSEINDVKTKLDQIIQILQENKPIIKRISGRIWTTAANVVIRKMVLCVFAFLLAMYTRSPNYDYIEQGCLSEQYHIPVHQDLPMLPYLSDHSSIVGREWLFNDLQNSLISYSNEANRNGVILVAEMGYGKSAIVSELICPKSKQIHVEDIRQHIFGFHICKFDDKATHNVGRFILRLAGFLALKSAQFGNIINMLPEHSLLFDKEGCNKEPIACFKQAVVDPLGHLKDVQDQPWIYIIDALDECTMSVKSDILQLLISRIKFKNLPLWFKFVITSRNETYLSSFRSMELQYLKPNDLRNKQDLKAYMDITLPSSPTKSRTINELIDKSDGNFVYVVQAVTWLLSYPDTSDIPELPSDIAHVYEINFDRQFETAEAYTIPKMILEIICSTVNPIDKDDIYNILNANNILMNHLEYDNCFHKLSFFLNTDMGIRIINQGLYVWLNSETNQYYRLSVERGHSYIARYLLSKMNSGKNIDLVNLAIHVGNSNDLQLNFFFDSSKQISTEINKNKNILHKVISQTRSVNPLKLILPQIDFVDRLNRNKVTAAFVAAAEGNVKQLDFLRRKGADITFQIRSNVIISPNVFDMLDKMKHVLYSGYGLLHIASQHGRLNVVEYLLRTNQSLLHVKNSLGMHAGHVACESGHLEVVQTMYKFNSSIFDFDCLYYSGKNNHIDIVEWLVSIGVKYKCISDDMSLSAIREIFEAKRLKQHLDKWWIVFKTDPLTAAIQSGSNATAAFISRLYPESMNCIDVFGFTPALTSVVYQRTELFPLFLRQILNDTCHKSSRHILDKKLLFIQQMSLFNVCPQKGGLAHLLAYYPLLDSLLYFTENQLLNKVNWDKVDILKRYPMDYAISNDNKMFINFNQSYCDKVDF